MKLLVTFLALAVVALARPTETELQQNESVGGEDDDAFLEDFVIPKVTLTAVDFELTPEIAEKAIVPIMQYLMMSEKEFKVKDGLKEKETGEDEHELRSGTYTFKMEDEKSYTVRWLSDQYKTEE